MLLTTVCFETWHKATTPAKPHDIERHAWGTNKCKTWRTKLFNGVFPGRLFGNVWVFGELPQRNEGNINVNQILILKWLLFYIGTGLVWRGRGDHYSICGAFCNITYSYSERHCRCLAGKFGPLFLELCLIIRKSIKWTLSANTVIAVRLLSLHRSKECFDIDR